MMNVFENKEDYLKLRNFWKKLHAEKKYIPVPEPQTRYEYSQHKIVEVGYHMVSPLKFEHHLIYLAAMGRDLDKATKGMWLSTITDIRNYFNYSWFSFFGDSIDEKYRDIIWKRIKDYFDMRYEAYRVNQWRRP